MTSNAATVGAALKGLDFLSRGAYFGYASITAKYGVERSKSSQRCRTKTYISNDYQHRAYL